MRTVDILVMALFSPVAVATIGWQTSTRGSRVWVGLEMRAAR